MCNPSVEPTKTHADSDGSRTFLEGISDAVDHALSSSFGSLGNALGMKPKSFMLLSLIITVVCTMGFRDFRSENRSEKLWIPQGTQAQSDQAKYAANYPKPFRIDYIIGVPTSSNNIITKDNLLSLMDIHDQVEAASVTVEDADWDLNSLCFQLPGDGHPCMINSVLQYWDYDKATLESDSDIQLTLKNDATEADLKSFLSDFSTDPATGDYSASGAKITYFLENRQVVVKGDYQDLPASEWEGKFLEIGETCASGLTCYRFAERSFSDEFGGAIGGDVVLMNIGFLIIIIYLCFNLGKCGDKISSRLALSMMSVLAVGMSIAASMGLSQMFDWPYTPVHSVLPFVLLGLGVDDSFVIMNSYRQSNPDDHIAKRMKETMAHAGVSITVTSMTDFVAFIISTSTSLPALASFCFYAATGILFLFLFQCIFFGAYVVIDERRQKARRMDCCCCFKVAENSELDKKREAFETNPGPVSDFMKNTYGPFIVNKNVGIVITLFSMALLGVGAYGASQLKVESNQLSFVPDNSYIQDTFRENDALFGGDGKAVSLVLEDFDYFAKQSSIKALKTTYDGEAHLLTTSDPNNYDSWYDSYVDYVTSACYGGCIGSNSLDAEGLPNDETQFYDNLESFLAGAGARYSNSVFFNTRTDIKTSKIDLRFDPAINDVASLEVEAMTQIRALTASLDIDAYSYTFNFLDWETYIVIEDEMISNVSLCMAAVFVITLILIAHPLTAGLVFLCVGCAIIEILGAMYFWGLVIDNVSVINLTLAVGLAVDYSAHVGHCFMLKPGNNRSERVIETLTDIGAAVLQGAISTFLAVVVLSGSGSYVFRVLFKQFFLTCVFGVGNGMIFLPVLLSWVGPRAYSNAGKSSHGEMVSVGNKEIEL